MTQGHESGTDEPRPAGPVGAGDPPPPPVAKASSGVGPPTPPPAGGTAPAEESGQSDADQVERDFEALLADAQREKEEYLELARRTQADFENYRKRMATEVQAATTRGKAALIGELVHVIDNLERALEVAGIDPGGGGEASEEALAQGIVLTYRDLCRALEGNGVEVIDPQGEKFDPTWHEALSTQAVEGGEPGVVVEVVQKGYRLGERLVRPARVVVSE